MAKHEDFNVGCPKCKGIIFHRVNKVVLRSVRSERAGKRYVYERSLVRCEGCASLVQILDDDELMIIEVKGDADKPSS